MEAQTYLALADIAWEAGIEVATARNYHKLATKRRAEGSSKESDLPAPDIILGKTPGWSEATIRPWLQARKRKQEEEAK